MLFGTKILCNTSILATRRLASSTAGIAPSFNAQQRFEAEKLKRTTAQESRHERTEEEKKLRLQLAAAYRLAHLFGWEELIYNHITCRLPSDPNVPERFLINPYGWGFDEVTASSLVTIDTDGNVLDLGSGSGRVNAAGFLIHSAVHVARRDAHCVIHCHQEDVVAVGARPEGLQAVGQAFYALGPITTHDYEGLALLEDEKKTLVRDLGAKSKVMILKNHGCLTLGETVAEAFIRLYFLVRACQQQVKAGPTAILPSEHVRHIAVDQANSFNSEGFGTLEFNYLMRKLERLQGKGYQQ